METPSWKGPGMGDRGEPVTQALLSPMAAGRHVATPRGHTAPTLLA